MSGPLARLAPARRRFYLAILALVSAIVLVGVVRAIPFGGESAAADAVRQDRPGPVLLVPGYGGSTASLEALVRVLNFVDRQVEVVDLGDAEGDLRKQAELLKSDVDELLERTGAPSVDLVGYSAGGVVVRWYVGMLGGADHTRRVVTLGSPHHGTETAALGGTFGDGVCPTACQQLIPDSDVLRALNRGDETPDGPLWTAVWTDDDQTVVPPTSGSLGGALDYAVQDVCPGLRVSHGDLPRSLEVALMVKAALDVDPPRRPGQEICPD